MCVYQEKSKNSTIFGDASCIDRSRRVLLRGGTQTANPRMDVILNQYRFFGPGVYNKERVNYSRKQFFKRMKNSKASVDRQFEDMRSQMNEEFAKKLKGNVMRKW